MKEDWIYKRGDLYYANLNPYFGSEQGGTRPVLVLQNNVGNFFCPTLIVAPLTSKWIKKKELPTHYALESVPELGLKSVVLLEQIKTIDKRRVLSYIGRVSREEMRAIDDMLVERKKEIDELMDLFGDEYIDNNLVFCSSNGRPMESQVINRAFNKLIKENGLPHVVFHSLRHSSITYKLKLNGGDMKSVQGDSGHAQVKMVADVYSHIIDEDRCINAQRLEEAFYSSKTPDPVEDTEPKTADTAVTESDESDAAKILELLKNPETAALLKQLAKAL